MNEASDIQIMGDAMGQQAPLLLCAVPLFALFGLWWRQQLGQILKRSWVAVLQVCWCSLPQPDVLDILDKQGKYLSRILKRFNFESVRKQVGVCGTCGNFIFMMALEPIGEKPSNAVVWAYPNTILSLAWDDVPDLLKSTVKANVEFTDDREVARAGSIPVVIEAADEAMSRSQTVGASLPNLWEDFSRHPSLELLCGFQLRAKDESIKARLIDISHRLGAAIGGGVVFHDILRVHMTGDGVPRVLVVERCANVIGDKPRLATNVNRPQSVLILILEYA